MTPSNSPQPSNRLSPDECKHLQVRIVSRDEDSEYVECELCGDVFESTEFKDMTIEERLKDEEPS